MIYLDNGATSFPKPEPVHQAVQHAMKYCTSPGRGGYPSARKAERIVYHARETAGKLFECEPEQVVFTSNCTHGLNIALRTFVAPGSRVVISGFEHNAVVRPLYACGAKITVAGRKLFDWPDTLEKFEQAFKCGQDLAVFTHASNVFGYILPVEELAALCRRYGVPFVIDAAQSAGSENISLKKLGADFIAMPGHKGLLGPAGTGLLLCGRQPEPLIFGGTGSMSLEITMPETLPERLEAGTMNVPAIAGLDAGMQWVLREGVAALGKRERQLAALSARKLEKLGVEVFCGEHQNGTVSFRMAGDCQDAADMFAEQGIALRAGLHCAPLAHESAGTLNTGTLRMSFGHRNSLEQTEHFLRVAAGIYQRLR